MGNVLTIADAAANGGTQTFTYDPLDRLATAVASGGYGAYPQQSYGYADNGNLTSFAGVTLKYTDTAHAHGVTMVANTQKYWYDPNGNATKRIGEDGATYEFGYDFENRVTQLKKNGAVISAFKYDGDGNRIVETTGGVTTAYLGNYYEWTASGAKSYYYAGNVRVAMRDSTGVRYLLGDHLGSTTLTTDSNGNRQTELRYYPYGKTRYPADPPGQAGAAPTTFRFTGQRWQNDANDLYFYQSRWYDPLVGRFLSADTIVPDPKNPQGLNRYTYVGNSPLRYVDPTGHCISTDTACLAALKALQERYRVRIDDRNRLWTLEQLSALQAGFDLLASEHSDGITWFRETFGGTNFVRENSSSREVVTGQDGVTRLRYKPAETDRGTIKYYNDAFDSDNDASLTTIHELAHVWDARSGDALSEGLVSATGGKQRYRLFGLIDVGVNLGPIATLGSYTPGGAPASAPQAQENRREDWAWSLTVTLSPGQYTIGRERVDYVRTVLSSNSKSR